MKKLNDETLQKLSDDLFGEVSWALANATDNCRETIQKLGFSESEAWDIISEFVPDFVGADMDRVWDLLCQD